MKKFLQISIHRNAAPSPTVLIQRSRIIDRFL